jgi:S-adenosylmethionine-dependent methyltransferase
MIPLSVKGVSRSLKKPDLDAVLQIWTMPTSYGTIRATMHDEAQARFDAGAEDWTRYNQKPLGRIRHEVTWHNLAPHLPAITDEADPPRVLDAGGGSGELALRLAECGYRVWLLDYAPAMLEQARRAAQGLPDEAQSRLSYCQLPADEASNAFALGFFQLITCHTLIEYLLRPQTTLRVLTSLLRDGGLLSLSFVNRHAEVLRQVWSRGDPAGALTRLEEGTFCAKLFDVPGRAYTAEEASAWLDELGLTATASCGVRCFADYVSPEHLDDPEFLEALLRLELAAATRPPYRSLARYVQLIARK